MSEFYSNSPQPHKTTIASSTSTLESAQSLRSLLRDTTNLLASVQIEPRSQSKCGNCGSRDALIEKLQKENAAKNKKIVELQQQVERQNEMLEKAMRKLRDSEERTKLQENRVPQTPANVSRPRMSVLSVRR